MKNEEKRDFGKVCQDAWKKCGVPEHTAGSFRHQGTAIIGQL
jgi:hypothetical protein